MKIIASDYDGTFNHNGVTEEKCKILNEWRNRGNLFGIISGRGFPSLLSCIEDKNFAYDFLVCNNGAVIYDSKHNIIFEERCKGELAKPLIEDLFKWGCPMANIDKDSPLKISNGNKALDENEIYIEDLPELEYFNQISTYLDTIDEASEVTVKINEKYKDIFTPLQNGNCIDIVPVGVDKAQGMYTLLKIIGGKYDDVIAVGDDINDTHMIKEFYSYAMENAVDSIKKLANGIVSDVTEIMLKY